MKTLLCIVVASVVALGSAAAHAQVDKSKEKIAGGSAALITGYLMLLFPTAFAFQNGDAREDRLTAQFLIPVVGPVATVHRLPTRHPLRADGREYVLAYSALLIQLEGLLFIVWGILEKRAHERSQHVAIAPTMGPDVRGITLSFRF